MKPGDPCGGAFYDEHGRQRAAGEVHRGQSQAGVYQGRMPTHGQDTKLDVPARPCARCGQAFQPTERRRLLCSSCFGWASSNDSPYEPDGESDGGPA